MSIAPNLVDQGDLAAPLPTQEEPTNAVRDSSIENDLGKQIFRAAAKKASELTMMPQVIREVADRLTKEDLPDNLKQVVARSEGNPSRGAALNGQ